MNIDYYAIADKMLEIVCTSAAKTIKNICDQITDIKEVSAAIAMWISSETFINRVLETDKNDLDNFWVLRQEVYLLSLIPLYYSMFKSKSKLDKIKPMIEDLINLAYRVQYGQNRVCVLAEINEIIHKYLSIDNIDTAILLKKAAAECTLSKSTHKGHILLETVTNIILEVKNDSNNN